MAPVVAEIASENKDTFVVARLNIKNARQTLQKYRIRIITPTYMVFQDGKFVNSFKGEMPKARLLQNILGALN